MKNRLILGIVLAALSLGCSLASSTVMAQGGAVGDDDLSGQVIMGFKIRVGGRFDNVRMCVASPAGAKGGMAADISLYTEIGLSKDMSIIFDLPVMRPILFATAFRMLQFEPGVTLLFRKQKDGKVDLVAGPTLGISLHYGPDYKSESSGEGRTESFFALGPVVGGYFGLDFKRPGETFNFQLGLQPYVIPLFGVDDPADHKGIVAGALLDSVFKFR